MNQFKKTLIAASIMAVVPAVSYAQLEEVIVTASKRAESLQDLSMSVTAISGDDLVKLGAADFVDVAASTPSVYLRSSGPGRTKLNIRGISAATGVAPTVSFYIDEMPIQTISSGSSTSFQQTIIDPKLYDLNRVEVLRGPQGTLYGSSSMGGTVRLITGQPDAALTEGSVNAELSNTEDGDWNYVLNGMYNLPTSDNSALRLVGSYTDRSGYIDRVNRDTGKTFDEEVNNEETLALRAAWRYEWESGFIQPFVFYHENEMDGKPSYYAFTKANGRGVTDDLEQGARFDAPEPFDDEFTMLNLTLSQDFGDSVNLVASLSDLDREFDNVEDITDQVTAAEIPAPEAVYADEKVELEDMTFEARLSSMGDSSLGWMGGVYYKDSTADAGYRMQRGFVEELSIYGLANTQDEREYDEWAVFGNLEFDIGESFSLALGARYLDYEYNQFKEDWGFVYDANAGGTDRPDARILDLTVEDDDVQGSITGTWHFSDTGQTYLAVSNGSRPGGGNRSIPRSTDPAEFTAYSCDQDLNALGISGNPESFEGDEVVNYELGLKSDLGSAFRLNAAVYRLEWDDIQQIVNTSGDCGFNFTTNTGEAVSQGVELEMSWLVTDNFLIDFNVGYTDAEFTEDAPGTGIEDGDKLADVPEWTFNAVFDWTIPMNAGQIFTLLSYTWVDDTLELAGQASDDTVPQGIVSGNVKPDYDMVNLRLGYNSDSNWQVVFFVDNLTDEEALYTYSDVLAFNIGAYDRTVRARPRTTGLGFTYAF
jgi:outer membrane receptor protein involved in Fe transport